MTTYYLRRTSDGEIVNAVETSDPSAAERIALQQDCFADPDPPTAVLRRYRYWNERP